MSYDPIKKKHFLGFFTTLLLCVITESYYWSLKICKFSKRDTFFSFFPNYSNEIFKDSRRFSKHFHGKQDIQRTLEIPSSWYDLSKACNYLNIKRH
jgi:hypothetical protein